MKKKVLLFCFLLSATIMLAGKAGVFNISVLNDSIKEITLNKYWKFHNGDDSAWAIPSFDDSKWDTIKSTQIPFGKNDSNIFTGIGWFRIHIFIDPSLNNTPLCLLIDQDGASQIFLDGKLIDSLGTVSSDIKKEKKYNPHGIPLSFRYGNAGEYLLAVRYSNLNYRKLFKKYYTNNPGFSIQIAKQDDSILSNLQNTILQTTISVSLGIFFLTLGFIHLLLFLFYRKQRTNLYYCVFVVLLAILFIIPAISSNLFDPELSIKNYYFLLFLLPVFFYSMLLLEFSIFKKTFGKSLAITTSIIILIGIVIMLIIGKDNFLFSFIFSFIIGTVCASFSIVVSAIIRKKNGAWIIGTGSLCFLIFIGTGIVSIMYKSSFGFQDNGTITDMLLFILILLTIMSIPISMSIYLAREFAQTNKNLEKKLIEVETLSEKSIEQEKEKQKILETQKDVLEMQVTERTAQITEQKKVIEGKNKDITDSINYAKTIQSAILPSRDFKHKIFPDSFILFKPKDIVSGDFYWLAEKDNKRLIAACDCTGHGVPGALMSMIGNNILNHLVNEKGITSPNEILNSLNKEIHNTLKQGEQSDSKDGMDIALIVFGSELEIEFAGAQRPLWIIRNQEEPSLIEVKGDKIAIGGMQAETERKFTNHKIPLLKGDTIYIFSDGFADQFSNENKKLMTSRFKNLLISIQKEKMQDQEMLLNNFIINWMGKHEQIDDILVIGIKV